MISDFSPIYQATISFDDLLQQAGIAQVIELGERDRSRPFGRTILLKDDGTYFELRYPMDFLARISSDWNTFVAMPEDSRMVIHEALSDLERMGPPLLRYRATQFEQSTADGSEVSRSDIEDIEKG